MLSSLEEKKVKEWGVHFKRGLKQGL